MEKHICKNCGKEYSYYPSIPKKSCSKKCTSELNKKEIWDTRKCTCKECGAEFLPKRLAEGSDFCSYKCRGKNSRHDRVDRSGYWYVCKPEHPNSTKQGYVPEHHLVMELKLGHYIEDGYIVHHIDENKKNNDISNLRYMEDSKHKSLHIQNYNADGIINSKKQKESARNRMVVYNSKNINKQRGEDGRYINKLQ